MNLFADYVQPLTNWLHTNPSWSLFITFIIALTESLAIIGSIIPGSVTMTAIGILAGSGVMRLDLTLIAATLGAICGDSLSYALGHLYRDQLVDMWPFKKYPKWLDYGKDFFARHGGKSVLIGRFVGPLRSIIPVIAGVLHMKQWRFLLANVISAIGWSLLYIMPGALIGAASNELSAESATRLFILILIILAVIWFISLIIKWLFSKLNLFLKTNLHDFWSNSKNNRKFRSIYHLITPADEENHYSTASLSLITAICLFLSIIFTLLSIKNQSLAFFNLPVHLFLQSFYTIQLKSFFIICTQFASSLTITLLYVICCFWFIYNKHIKAISYLTSLIIISNLISVILVYIINSPRPSGLLITMPGSSFPVINLVTATAFYGFILFYINNKYALLTKTLRSIILIILGLSGFGAIYLGDVWLTDVITSYLLGVSIGLIHYLIYRKSNYTYLKKAQPSSIIFFLLASIIAAMSLSTYLNFDVLSYNHTPFHKEYIMKESTWWNQQKPILPLYRLNRIGHRISLLNIQYVGNLESFEQSLNEMGWQTHSESFFTKLLMQMNNKTNEIQFPLLAQLFENRPPELIMIYKNRESGFILELNIWKSNYNVSELNNPIWIGTIHQNIRKLKNKDKDQINRKLINPLTYLIPSLKSFTLRRIELSQDMISSTLFPAQPTILLIRKTE